MVSGQAVQKYGPDLEEHQQLLLAASDIMINIYMAESGLLRAEKTMKSDPEKGQNQMEMAQLYLYHAVDKIILKAKEGIISFSEGDEQRMMLMGLKRFTKYVHHPNIIALRVSIADKVIAANHYPF